MSPVVFLSFFNIRFKYIMICILYQFSSINPCQNFFQNISPRKFALDYKSYLKCDSKQVSIRSNALFHNFSTNTDSTTTKSMSENFSLSDHRYADQRRIFSSVRPPTQILAITIPIRGYGNKFQILKRNFALLMKDLLSSFSGCSEK